MRLLFTLSNAGQASQFAQFLTEKGIENRLEINKREDWGRDDYGDMQYDLWVVDEEAFDQAVSYWEKFQQNPTEPLFTIQKRAAKRTQPPPPSFRKNGRLQTKPVDWITFYLFLICSLLFALSVVTAPPRTSIPNSLRYPPLYLSPIQKMFFYDYPYAFTLLDKLVETYGIKRLQKPSQLPPPGQQLMKTFLSTPFWQGLYPGIVASLQKKPPPLSQSAPLFEKIRTGEVWRLITPCLLHNDILHLLFNLLWLIVIGRQIEQKLHSIKYLVLILLFGIFSNTAQYLVSGANFIGLSGILCGMIAFVWTRQKRAPWEGYQLLPATMAFISLFVLGMFFFSLTSFVLEVVGKQPFAPAIANTAHLSGALMGFAFGRFSFFARTK